MTKKIKNAQLGKLLRKSRESQGLSLRALADETGIDHSFIAKLEQGLYATPDPKKLQRLAHALEIDVEDFYALAGYLSPEGLPAFAPYLRAKYELPARAVSELEDYFEALREKYGKPTERKGGRRGQRAR